MIPHFYISQFSAPQGFFFLFLKYSSSFKVMILLPITFFLISNIWFLHYICNCLCLSQICDCCVLFRYYAKAYISFWTLKFFRLFSFSILKLIILNFKKVIQTFSSFNIAPTFYLSFFGLFVSCL